MHLRGARLANLGGQHCLFSTSLEPAPATWIGFEHLTLTLTLALFLTLTPTSTLTLTLTLTLILTLALKPNPDPIPNPDPDPVPDPNPDPNPSPIALALALALTRFEHLTCLSPSLPTPSTLPTSTAAGYKSISTSVLVSVNGVLAEASAPDPTTLQPAPSPWP